MSQDSRFPLVWPPGWRRTPDVHRKSAHFGKRVMRYSDQGQPQYSVKERLTISQATGRVLRELGALGTKAPIISTNLRLRNDGLPMSGQREPVDPGAAVYWTDKKKRQKVMASDQYTKTADNLAAIAATLEAMRAIERHGGAMILDRAFTGFEALPAPNVWWLVLQVKETATLAEVKAAYQHLAKLRHPDAGGSDAAMADLHWAYDQAKKELS